MTALIRKEWRENRALVLAFFVLAPIASLAVMAFVATMPNAPQAEAAVDYVIPGLLGLFLFVVGSDLVASETSSGRIAFLAALPVRPSKIWAAKALFLYGAATLYLGFLLATECGLLAAIGGNPGRLLFWAGYEKTPWLLYLAVGGASALFFSGLIDRGLAAAFAALLFLGALWFGAVGLLKLLDVVILTSQRATLFRFAVAIAGAGFLAGSFLSFTRGRIHLGGRARRAALAFSALLVALAAPAAYAEARIALWRRVSPTDRDLSLNCYVLSPDGTYAIVSGVRSGAGPFGLRGTARGVTWAVPLDGGPVREARTEHEGNRISGYRDADTGELLWETRRIPSTPVATHRTWARLDWRWSTDEPRRPIWSLVTAADGVSHDLPEIGGRWSGFWLPDEPGDVLLARTSHYDRASRLSLLPVYWREGRVGEPVLEGVDTGFIRSGRYSLFFLGDRVVRLDRRDLSFAPVPALEGFHRPYSLRGGNWFGVRSPDGLRILRLTDSGEVEFARMEMPATGTLQWFDGENAIVRSADGHTLNLLLADGTRRRLLPRQ